jgi:hypothetical protein
MVAKQVLRAFSPASYRTNFADLPEQLATDAYLKENAEPMKRGVAHFLSLQDEGKLILSSEIGSVDKPYVVTRLAHQVFSRIPLVVKTWVGEITLEDARRHAYWHYGDMKQFWGVQPEHLGKTYLPEGVTHPTVFALSCLETQAGQVVATPWFVGAPSDDVDDPNFVALPAFVVRTGIKPGHIQVPAPITKLDATTINYLQPLEQVCRDHQPEIG